jgi:hypothetical protein
MKLISKNNISVVITLILVVLLSQAQIFDFFLESYLGRLALLSFVIFIAMNSKVLGLVAVLAIIIMFNYFHIYNIREIEGAETMSSANKKEEDDSEKKINSKELKDAVDINKKAEIDKPADNTEDKTEDKAEDKTEDLMDNISKKITSALDKKDKGKEGFCMSDKESTILRGKRPNSVPVFSNLRRQSDDVSPFEKSDFTSDFASV